MPTNVVVQNHNRKIRNPIPQRYVSSTVEHAVFLINLSDQTFIFQRTYGAYVLLGRRGDEPYTITRVAGRMEVMDEGDSKYGQQLTEAEDIAADLAGQANTGILVPENGDSFIGVFVCEKLVPCEACEDSGQAKKCTHLQPPADQLEEMRARLNGFYDGQIQLADLFYDDKNDHKNISNLMRRAAKYRNQTRPWTYEAVNMASCPACGTNIKSGVAICATCHAIIDEPKARKFFPDLFRSAEQDSEPAPKPAPRARKAPQTTAA